MLSLSCVGWSSFFCSVVKSSSRSSSGKSSAFKSSVDGGGVVSDLMGLAGDFFEGAGCDLVEAAVRFGLFFVAK